MHLVGILKRRDISLVLGELLQITVMIAEVFERLGVRYFVGGSLVSSIHGIPRAT